MGKRNKNKKISAKNKETLDEMLEHMILINKNKDTNINYCH